MAETSTTAPAGVVFKGRMMTLTVLEITDTDVERIAQGVSEQCERAPGFFAGMPVLLSLPETLPDLARVCQVLREADLVVIGVLDADDEAAKAAQGLGLGMMSSPARSAAAREPRPAAKATAPESENETPRQATPADNNGRTPSRLVTRPVRSGQQIYARGGDLVVAATVSEGAEVLADGHIHIYGTLRGRALAGATGDTRARIFCQRFEPDLVAIAGCYKVADAIDTEVLHQAVQVSLANDNLRIDRQE